MNELDFLKQEFLKDSNPFCVFHGDNEINRAANIFQNQFDSYIEKIKHSQSINEMKEYVQKSREIFLEQWKVAYADDSIPVSQSKQYLQNAFFKFNLNNPDKWFDSMHERFQEKNKANFFEKIKDGFNFIQKQLFNSDEHVDKLKIKIHALELISKYNLASIDLSGIHPSKAMDFLNTLDKNAQKVCDSIGVTPDVLGIHRTISFAPERKHEAFFQPTNNSIHLGFLMKDSSTILHEWVHALDYHIGSKIIPNSYATDIEHSVFIDDSNAYNAFTSMKNLSQEIFAKNPEVVGIVKKQLFKNGTAKFWNDLLGDDSYLLSNETRTQLQSEKSFLLINNFLSQPYNKDSQDNIINILKENGIATPERVNLIINPDPDSNLFKSKDYFDNVNKNIVTKQSAYYLMSNLSNFMSRRINLFSEKIMSLATNTPMTKSNITDSNYLTQPVEMMARYFESQVFNNNSNFLNAISVPLGIIIYKVKKDDSFEENKNKIISTVFGKDKIVSNIQKIRESSLSSNDSSKLKI